MIKDQITLDEAIAFLDSLVQIDPLALGALTSQRVAANAELAAHPSVQLSPDSKVGMIGILNGMFGADEEGNGAIAFCFDEENNALLSVERYSPQD